MSKEIPKPLFSVGEVVILQSRHSIPENGSERTVLAVIRATGRRSKFTDKFVPECWGYIVSDYEVPWAESALRKKHEGCDHSFDSLLHSLTSPDTLTDTLSTPDTLAKGKPKAKEKAKGFI